MLKNPKHEKFCQAIVSGMTTVAAYEFAGYAPQPNSGNRGNALNLKNRADVSARIDELTKLKDHEFVVKSVASDIRAIESSGIDKAEMIRRADKLWKRSMQEEPVFDRDGETPKMVSAPNGEKAAQYKFDSGGAAKALEILGKLTGTMDKRTPTDIPDLPADRQSIRDQVAEALDSLEQTEDGTAPDADGALTRPSDTALH